MADYYPLISRAVAGLEKNSGENRRALYERARKALVDQLRGVQPPLSETDITRERLALEEAIRKVETDSARQMRQAPPPPLERKKAEEPSPPPPPSFEPPVVAETSPPAPESPPEEEAKPSLAPEAPTPEISAPIIPSASELLRRTERQWLDKKPPETAPERLKGFSDVVADAESLGNAVAKAGRNAREAFSAVPSPSPEFDRLEPRMEPGPPIEPRPRQPERPRPQEARAPDRSRTQPRPPERPRPPAERRVPRADLGPVIGEADEVRARTLGTHSLEPPVMPESFRYVSDRARQAQQDESPGLLRRFMGGVGLIAIVGVVLLLVAGTAYWQRHNLASGVGKLVSLIRSSTSSSQTPSQNANQQRAKINDRIGQQDQGQTQADAPVAQRVVMYEEDPKDSNGKRFAGTVVWKSEQVRGERGQPADRTIRGDITIPERNISVTWILGRNFDRTLQFSHTISIQFNFPPGFEHGEVSEIRGVLMKPAEQVRGESLAGIAVKVKENFFLIGLNSADAEYQRNVKALKERPWFDIAILYKDNLRAILAVEKGTPGERTFADTFTAWNQ